MDLHVLLHKMPAEKKHVQIYQQKCHKPVAVSLMSLMLTL